MAMPYEIKSSDGKGEGVFATRDIAVGEVIMEDDKTMVTTSTTSVLRAFEDLSLDDQTRFLQLHEGGKSYFSKIQRIYYVCINACAMHAGVAGLNLSAGKLLRRNERVIEPHLPPPVKG